MPLDKRYFGLKWLEEERSSQTRAGSLLPSDRIENRHNLNKVVYWGRSQTCLSNDARLRCYLIKLHAQPT